MELQLSAPQHRFLTLGNKFNAYVGGFGSGKTFINCVDLLLFAGANPKTRQGYFGLSYPSIRDIFYPTIDEVATLLGFRVNIRVGDKEVDIYRGRYYYGTIICRSMDDPASIVGFNIARAAVDEIDLLPVHKAEHAWRKIIARMRLKIDGVMNTVNVSTTPEGFKWVYNQFSKDPTKSYSMVQASTYENAEHLPDDYIPSLLETYTEELVNAYVGGMFCNLTSGTVYHKYDRVLNRSTESVIPGEPLFIGMDFNVGKMAAVVYVKRQGDIWHGVDEIVNLLDTPEMVESIKSKYCNDGMVSDINIYPDASGDSRKTNNASESDISLLESAGFMVHVNNTNPAVKDRILSANKAFETRKVLINDNRCPTVASNLEQQVYNSNGEPDKKSGHDHTNDAGTYPIVYNYPIIKPASKIQTIWSR